jgi:hypothetical protein
MTTNRKIILALSIVMMFAMIIIMFTLYVQSRRPSQLDPIIFEEMTSEEIIDYFQERQSSRPIPMFYFIPVIGFSGLLVGSLVYYMLSEKIVVKEKQLENNTEIIMRLLDSNEKYVVKKLLEEGGKVHQSELNYLPNMTKVKAHRILKKLEQRGVIKKEKLGKINMVRLEDSIYQTLKGKN